MIIKEQRDHSKSPKKINDNFSWRIWSVQVLCGHAMTYETSTRFVARGQVIVLCKKGA